MSLARRRLRISTSRVGFGSRPDASGVGRTLVGVIHLQGTVAWITTQQSMS